MPIAVECPKCESTLSAPDSAAGKKIRCPECQAVVPVPAEDAAEEAPRPKRRKKPAEAAEDDDRPRKRKRKGAKRAAPEEDDEPLDDDEDDGEGRGGGGGGPTIPAPVWIAYGICLLAILIGIGASVYVVRSARDRDEQARRERDQPVVKPASTDDAGAGAATP